MSDWTTKLTMYNNKYLVLIAFFTANFEIFAEAQETTTTTGAPGIADRK